MLSKKHIKFKESVEVPVTSRYYRYMKIDREVLYKLYMEEVESIAEECDWKTHFGPQEIVSIIANILENNTFLVDNKKGNN